MKSLVLVCGVSHWSWKQAKLIFEVSERVTYRGFWPIRMLSDVPPCKVPYNASHWEIDNQGCYIVQLLFHDLLHLLDISYLWHNKALRLWTARLCYVTTYFISGVGLPYALALVYTINWCFLKLLSFFFEILQYLSFVLSFIGFDLFLSLKAMVLLLCQEPTLLKGLCCWVMTDAGNQLFQKLKPLGKGSEPILYSTYRKEVFTVIVCKITHKLFNL